MSDTILKRGRKERVKEREWWTNGYGKEGKEPEDLRLLGLVNKVKSGLIKVIRLLGQGKRHLVPNLTHDIHFFLLLLQPKSVIRKWGWQGRGPVPASDSTCDPGVSSFPHGPLLPSYKSWGPNTRPREREIIGWDRSARGSRETVEPLVRKLQILLFTATKCGK